MEDVCVDFKGTPASICRVKPTPGQLQLWKQECGDTPVEIYEIKIFEKSVLTLFGKNELNEFLSSISNKLIK